MAILKRSHTSSGNRKKFTYAFWYKQAEIPSGNKYFFSLSDDAGANWDESRLLVNSSSQLRYVASDLSVNVLASKVQRDSSAWKHIMVVGDSTLQTSFDRVKLYVNGIRVNDLSTTDMPARDVNFAHNFGGNILVIGSYGEVNPQFDIEGELFDIFNVDGQALTPDVFGYHKDGAGYVSVGTTQATSFKRGQWVPKKPSAIKAAINAEGGFGVNGFYLPINDGSNMGADFHCEPNSIITLKGENNPQPRNGAPDTTDAYVSQLRTDPYAANLVLAVPGIELENTNTELVPNGTFDTDITGWTGYNSTPTWDSVNQRLAINASTEFDGVETSSGISVSANTKYTFKVDIHLGTAGGIRIQIRDSSNAAGTLPTVDIDTSGTHIVNFDSLSNTSVYIRLITSGGNTGTAYFDNISIKEAVAVRDYSADIKGSGSNKTLTANGDAGVALVPSYYGSALSFDGSDDYFTLPANTSDLLLGSSDFTIECWVNKTNSGQQDVYGLYQTANNRRSYLLLTTDTQTVFYLNETGSSGINATANVVTPLNQWTHIAAERYGSNLTLYINGVAGAANTTANFTAYNNTVDSFMIGASDYSLANGSEFTGQIQDLRVYKGVAKYKGGFDVPKPYTPVNFQSWRAVSDTTANNFATLNPLHHGTSIAESDGNLSATWSGSGWQQVTGTVGVSTGKWYWESVQTSAGNQMSGIILTGIGTVTVHMGQTTDQSLGYYGGNGNIYYNSTDVAYGDTWTQNDIIGVAFNATDRQITFYKNGSSQGTVSGYTVGIRTEGTYAPAYATNNSGNASFNFGQNPSFSGTLTAGTYADSNGKGLFKYQPPTGFLALCEDNLPTPAIANPGEHFKTVLWTGDGTSGTTSIKGFGFKPDLIWLKGRSSTGNHGVWDSVRGATNRLTPNLTDAESISNGVVSFDDDGFSRGIPFSASGSAYVAWGWKAGGAAVSNTDGTITSQVSANQDAGFSIVSFTKISGTQTVGHGLGKTPKFIITKQRDGSYGWWTYHESIGQSYLELNSTNAAISLTWGGTNNSSVFYINNSYAVAGQRVIAYCWAEIEGFSKFGSYVGNGSADGPFVYCGFKPAFVLWKNASNATGYNWYISDNTRSSTNPVGSTLAPNTSNIEDNGWGTGIMDFTSNGFKIRRSPADTNTSGDTFIFAAFAESPFQTANAK
jgi:hypothetical protein